VITKFKEQPWLNSALAALCIALIVFAAVAVGPASQSSGQSTRTATVQRGVVQSTVSGTGNVQAAGQLDLGFKTGGTVTHVYVKSGQKVVKGQLLATLDPQSAEVTLEQARASLQAAQANLAGEEESNGETSSAQGSGGSSATAAATTSTGQSAAPAPATQSAATREANLASARAASKSAQLTVESDEKAVENTKLYAPEDGTIVALSGEVGETVSATGTTKAATVSSSSSSASSTGATGASTGTTGSAGTSSSSSSGSSGATPFAVISNLESMQLLVALSESEIGSVKVGQMATVTLEALSGKKVAADVSSIDQLPTSTSGVVSYDVTFQLDQGESGVKTGMSATAEVVVKQEQGLSVPSSAISAGSVTVVRGGKDVRRQVTTGLVGNSATIVLSGLKAGEEVLLPVATSTSSGTAAGGRAGGFAGGAAGGFAGGGLGGGGGGLAGGAAGGGRGG
jgi:multidrug efflux pump subunit AcrA (membrane-fusion protein)